MATRDLVGVVEAAYAVRQPDDQWIMRLLEAARPSLDRGLGVFGYYADVSARPARVDKIFFVAGSQRQAALVAPTHGKLSGEQLNAMYRTQPVVSLIEIFGAERLRALDVYREVMQPEGIEDALAVIALDVAGRGWVLGVQAHSEIRVSPRERSALWRIGVHVAAADRLRRALRGEVMTDNAAAVLRPDGRVLHAEASASDEDARESLACHVRAIERARGPLRRSDPDGALELWTGLVRGRYSVVEVEDSDGQRLMIARENPPDVQPLLRLTATETTVLRAIACGRSNKQIQYELGLEAATVSGHVTQLLLKLGVGTRAQLAERFATLVETMHVNQ